jgi:hypothetical protein
MLPELEQGYFILTEGGQETLLGISYTTSPQQNSTLMPVILKGDLLTWLSNRVAITSSMGVH